MSAEILILCSAAFVAGFIDAIVGGGGLVQTPATLITLPQYNLATLIGTTKIPAFVGTSIATVQYAKRVVLQWKLLLGMSVIAFMASFMGSVTVAHISNAFMKPIMFCVLIAVVVYTYTNKNFGTATTKGKSFKQEVIYGILFSLVVGFYDGFIGPGTGSFLIVFFISILGFDFLKASAHAKFVNLATNLGSICFFSLSGNILFNYAIPMAICNLSGSFLGARLALLKGNKFIRVFFLIVVCGTILRFGYDIFIKK
ncbi:MAG: sulfite exporter TauE/SafE family protein [Bacteroidia bacterium]